MKTLKTAVIRLAYANPELRSKLLPLLREAHTGRLDPEMFRILKKGAGMVRGGNLTSLEVLPTGSISLYGFTGDGRHGYEGEFGYEVTYYVGVDGEGYGGYLRGEIQPDNGMGSNRDVFYQYVTFPANASAADVAAILQPVWNKTWKAAEKMASKSTGFEDYTPPSPRRGPHRDSLEGHPGVRRRRSAGCEKLPDALREQCEKKVEEGEKSDKTASSSYEVLGMLGIGFTESAKVYSQIEETDEQTAELLGEVISELSKYLTLGRGQLEALKRIQSLFENYRKWDPALIRNNVFKAANSMGMRLPSGMFASQAD